MPRIIEETNLMENGYDFEWCCLTQQEEADLWEALEELQREIALEAEH